MRGALAAEWVKLRSVRSTYWLLLVSVAVLVPVAALSLFAVQYWNAHPEARGHMGMSPMTYLRQVRLRQAHQELLESDPSVETVASIARRWGYSNPGRFAAVHATRYGETPAATLRRSGRAIPVSRLRTAAPAATA